MRALALALLLCGCAAGIADTYATLTVQERALGVGLRDLPDVSKRLQVACAADAASRADNDACLKSVRARAEVAQKSLIGAQAATVTARDMIEGVAAASQAPKAVMSWVGVAIRAYTDVESALALLGYHLGGP